MSMNNLAYGQENIEFMRNGPSSSNGRQPNDPKKPPAPTDAYECIQKPSTKIKGPRPTGSQNQGSQIREEEPMGSSMHLEQKKSSLPKYRGGDSSEGPSNMGAEAAAHMDPFHSGRNSPTSPSGHERGMKRPFTTGSMSSMSVQQPQFEDRDDSPGASSRESSELVKKVKRESGGICFKDKSKALKADDKDLKGKSTSTSKSAKAGLIFPVSRLVSHMKHSTNVRRIGSGAPVYLASVLEYLCAEILELAGNSAIEGKKQRIGPRHIQLAISNDEELHKYLGHATIASGGVRPNINAVLLKREHERP